MRLANFLNALFLAMGMFTAIPTPFRTWDKAVLGMVLPCLPIVGTVIGLIWWGLTLFCVQLDLPPIISAALVGIAPFLLTGFFHLDGYLDTSDAILSRRSLEEKRRILKDPHMGAMAGGALATLFILQFAFGHAILAGDKALVLLVFICIISRCCTSFAVSLLRPLPQSDLASALRPKGLASRVFVVTGGGVAIFGAFFFGGLPGLLVTAATIIGFTIAGTLSYRELGGFSGDLAGYSLVVGELCGLGALALL